MKCRCGLRLKLWDVPIELATNGEWHDLECECGLVWEVAADVEWTARLAGRKVEIARDGK